MNFDNKKADMSLAGVFGILVLLSVFIGFTVSMLVPAADKISDPALLGYGKAGYDQKRALEREARRYGFAAGRHSYGEDSSGWKPSLSVDEGGASLVGGVFCSRTAGFF